MRLAKTYFGCGAINLNGVGRAFIRLSINGKPVILLTQLTILPSSQMEIKKKPV
jgi:hypothetical protein